MELRGDDRRRERDRDDVEEREEVTRAHDPQELALVGPDGNPVEPRGDIVPATVTPRVEGAARPP